MKIAILVDRQSGPVIGSRLLFEHVIHEPDLDELRLPVEGSDFDRTKAYNYRQRFIDQIAAILARSISRGLEQALDGREPVR